MQVQWSMLKVQHFAHFVLAERQTWILQRDLPMNNLHTCQPVRANDFPVAIAVVESSSYSWLVVKPLNFWGPYLVCSSVMGWAHKPDAICVGQTFISRGGDLQYCWCSLPAAFGQAWDSKSRNFPTFSCESLVIILLGASTWTSDACAMTALAQCGRQHPDCRGSQSLFLWGHSHGIDMDLRWFTMIYADLWPTDYGSGSPWTNQ